MPTCSNSSMTRRRAALAFMPSCRRSVSASWKPIVKDGLSEVVGSWKIIATSLPVSARRSRSDRLNRSRPSNDSLSAVTRPGNGTRPIRASIPTLLPEPDSPTIPSTSPLSSARLTPSTARNSPLREGNDTERFLISRSGMEGSLVIAHDLIRKPVSTFRDHALALQLGIERVAQPVAEKVERQHRHQDRNARQRHHPPGAQHEFARIRQHGPPFGQRRLCAEPEKSERRRIEYRGGNPKRRLHDQWRGAIRQHLLEHQAQPARAR